MTGGRRHRLTFSSTSKLRQVEKPKSQKLSFRLRSTFKNPSFVHFSRLRVRKQNKAVLRIRREITGSAKSRLTLIDDHKDA